MRRLVLLLLLLASLPAFAQTADLVLLSDRPFDGPLRIGGGEVMELNFSIANLGPATARDVAITIDIPPGVLIDRIYGGESTCDYGTTPLRCRTPDLASGARLFFEIHGTAPSGVTAELTLRATGTTSTPESSTANNTARAVYQVGPAIDLNVQAAGSPLRLPRGSTFTTAVSVSDYGRTSHDLSLHFEVANGTFERIAPPDGWSCQTTATSAVCTAAQLDEGCRCSGDFHITTRVHDRIEGGDVTITVRAGAAPQPEFYTDNNARTIVAQVYRDLLVTTAADSGPGSLRAAIDAANASCSPGPCRIAFAIPASDPNLAWVTLTPALPFPPITADRIFIDGSTQSAFMNDRNPAGPELAISGHLHATGDGLDLRSACEAIVQGLAIGHFAGHALVVSQPSRCPAPQGSDARRITGNHLGVAPDGRLAWPNLRGLQVEQTAVVIEHNVISGNRLSGVWTGSGFVAMRANRIGTAADGIAPLPNGRSGIFLGPEVRFAELLENTISYNAQMGVAIAAGALQVDIRQNSMRENGGLGIDWELDGVSPPRADDSATATNAPVLLSAIYDAASNKTIVRGRVDTDPLGPYVNAVGIDFYANAGPDGDGEQWIGAAGPRDGVEFTGEIAGDFRGRWINATSTRTHWVASHPPDPRVHSDSYAGGASMTSEFSNAVPVQ